MTPGAADTSGQPSGLVRGAGSDHHLTSIRIALYTIQVRCGCGWQSDVVADTGKATAWNQAIRHILEFLGTDPGPFPRICPVCDRDLTRDRWPHGGFLCRHCDLEALAAAGAPPPVLRLATNPW